MHDSSVVIIWVMSEQFYFYVTHNESKKFKFKFFKLYVLWRNDTFISNLVFTNYYFANFLLTLKIKKIAAAIWLSNKCIVIGNLIRKSGSTSLFRNVVEISLKLNHYYFIFLFLSCLLFI